MSSGLGLVVCFEANNNGTGFSFYSNDKVVFHADVNGGWMMGNILAAIEKQV